MGYCAGSEVTVTGTTVGPEVTVTGAHVVRLRCHHGGQRETVMTKLESRFSSPQLLLSPSFMLSPSLTLVEMLCLLPTAATAAALP